MTKKILVVDDNLGLAEMIQMGLSRKGYLVNIATTENQCRQELQENAPDLVITDIFMPGHDGIGLIRKLRAGHPQVKIIAMSGTREWGTTAVNFLDIASKLGADRILPKPFEVKSMVSLVRELID